MKFAFLTRHAPTEGQLAIAAASGIELIPVGDADAFSVTPDEVLRRCPDAEGVVLVHPAAAMRLHDQFLIGVFENANHAPEGEKPSFEAVALHLYDSRD